MLKGFLKKQQQQQQRNKDTNNNHTPYSQMVDTREKTGA